MRELSPIVLIRVDGNLQIGTGHVMRCIAIAQALQKAQAKPIFLMSDISSSLHDRLLSFGMDVRLFPVQPGSHNDAMQTAHLARQLRAEWVVLDSYNFDSSYQKLIKEHNLSLLFIDDNVHSSYYYADLVLNQNIYAQADMYPNKKEFTRLLLGVDYALLRDEFLDGWIRSRQIASTAKKILVTLGGGDINNVTEKVLRAISLASLAKLEIVVLIGDNSPYIETIRKLIYELRLDVKLISDPSRILDWMKWADMAISGAGSTCYELAFMGIPNLVIILADNQRLVAPGLDAAGISINLGWYADISPKDIAAKLTELARSPVMRAKMSRRGRELVDGHGAERVVQHMYGKTLTLRDAQEDDSQHIFEWANDPMTRAVSFSTEAIPWDTHQAWYTAKLADPRGIILLALDLAGTPVGMVRYQLEGMESVVSINLAPDQRGKGYGVQMLQASAEMLFKAGRTNVIHAYIKPDNTPSLRVFSKAGFIEKGRTDFHGNPACHFMLSKEIL